MNYAKQIRAWEAKLADLGDDDDERETIQKHLDRLKAHQSLIDLTDDAPARGTATPKSEGGLVLARVAKARAMAVIKQCSIEQAARTLYGSSMGALVAKAADPVVTADVPTAPSVQDFVQMLRAESLYDRLNFRHVSPYVPIAVQTVQATAGFVGEGTPATTSKWKAETLTLEPKKLVSLVPATIESIRDASVQADRLLTRDMLGAIRNTTDSVLLGTADATSHAPAGLLHNIAPIGSSGDDAEAVQADVKGLLLAIDPLLRLEAQLIMNPMLAFNIGGIRNELGTAVFPTIGIGGGTLEGVQVLVSNAVAMGTIVCLVDSEIYSIGDRGVEVEFSNSATIDGDSAFQNAFVAFRAIRPVSWAFRRANVIAYMTGADYGVSPSTTA